MIGKPLDENEYIIKMRGWGIEDLHCVLLKCRELIKQGHCCEYSLAEDESYSECQNLLRLLDYQCPGLKLKENFDC